MPLSRVTPSHLVMVRGWGLGFEAALGSGQGYVRVKVSITPLRRAACGERCLECGMSVRTARPGGRRLGVARHV